MTLLVDQDQQSLMTDPTIVLSAADGRQQAIIPFRLGMQQPMVRRDPSGVTRSYPAGVPPMISQVAQQAGISLSLPLTTTNGTPISVPAQMKKMQPPVGLPHMRISSNGGMRPPGLPVGGNMSGNVPAPHSSPPHAHATGQHSSPENGANGINRGAISMPHLDVVKSEVNSNPSIPNGVHNHQLDGSSSSDSNGNAVGRANSPTRPKSQNQHHTNIPINGYHLTPMNGYATTALTNTTPYLPSTGLSMQQVQNLKSAFANMPPGQDLTSMQANGGRSMPASYTHGVPNGANFNMQLGAGANMNLKLPTTRQMQWAAVGSHMQRPTSVGNGMEGVVMNGSISPSPHLAHAGPVRTPSANGSRAGLRGVGVPQGVGHVIGQNGQLGSHSMSPHHQHNPSPMPLSISQSQSPPHPSQLPMMMPSPSLQHQLPVGSSQGGY
jgi:enhancer of polycomb-like protein